MQNKNQGIFQLTLIRKLSNKRPRTSFLNRGSNIPLKLQKNFSQNDPITKMKQMKAQAKRAQNQYLQVVKSLKQSQKCINQNYKQAQRKKVSFIKLYQTKKLKKLSSNLIGQCKTERLRYDKQGKQHAQRIKIQQQIKQLVSRQEKQTSLVKLRGQIHKQKQKFQNRKFLKSNQLYNNSRKSFLGIKQSHEENKQRKKHIKSVSDVRSRHNYWKRVSQQVIILEQYEKVLKDLQNFDSFNLQLNQQRAQTVRDSSKGKFFFTQKNELRK